MKGKPIFERKSIWKVQQEKKKKGKKWVDHFKSKLWCYKNGLEVKYKKQLS